MVSWMTVPLVLFGGTFDPVHCGHLQLAIDICEYLQLNQINLVPNGQPAHRQLTGASAQQRLEMLELAVAGYNKLVIDSREIQRQGNSYMVDTLQELRQLNGPYQTIILCLGSDAFASLTGWYQWQLLLDYANLLILQRPRTKWTTNTELTDWYHLYRCDDPLQLIRWPAGYISSVMLGQYHISATSVRTSVARGQALVTGWLTPAVAKYVAEHHLYMD
jgi:nicotinate-nucleotide adenylyltransferase